MTLSVSVIINEKKHLKRVNFIILDIHLRQ